MPNKIEDLELKAQNKEQLIKSVQRFRKNSKLTQEELSEKSGVPQSSISKFELGTREPSLNLLFKILSALNLEIVIRKKKRIQSKTEGIVI